METGTRLRLAFAGLHPDQTRKLLNAQGPRGALLRVEAGAVGSAHAAEAVVAPAAVRREELRRLGVTPLWRERPEFPPWLGERPDSPDVLFVRGKLPVAPGVAVVGTRRCTSYGRELAVDYGRAIAAAGWPLISGLARGIDGAAHRGTVEAEGVGVAVLGCGIDVAYPQEHAALAAQLVEHGGAVVTEYPPGTPPEGWRFPPRNRIISGLSAAVVVVEAHERGGALITAASALEQGVPVFAVPGDVGRASSKGTNALIRDGAQPVLEPADLIAELSLVLGPPLRPQQAAAAAAAVVDEPLTPEQCAVAWKLSLPDVLARIARLEADGLVAFDGAVVRSR